MLEVHTQRKTTCPCGSINCRPPVMLSLETNQTVILAPRTIRSFNPNSVMFAKEWVQHYRVPPLQNHKMWLWKWQLRICWCFIDTSDLISAVSWQRSFNFSASKWKLSLRLNQYVSASVCSETDRGGHTLHTAEVDQSKTDVSDKWESHTYTLHIAEVD